MTDYDEWNTRLEAEGLGVIDPRRNWDDASKDIKHIKGKHKRLDAAINAIESEADAFMTNSPVTARAVETRHLSADDVQFDLDDGLHDIDEDADSAWDLMMISFIATPKEAEIAGRARSSALGLDSRLCVKKPKIRRRTKAQKAANIRARQRGLPEPYPLNPYVAVREDVDGDACYAVPRPQLHLGDSGLPCASSDAGSGPLAVVDRPKPDYGSPRDESIKPSPVVDTLGYAPGRSPFQLSLAQRGARRNSDITSG